MWLGEFEASNPSPTLESAWESCGNGCWMWWVIYQAFGPDHKYHWYCSGYSCAIRPGDNRVRMKRFKERFAIAIRSFVDIQKVRDMILKAIQEEVD